MQVTSNKIAVIALALVAGMLTAPLIAYSETEDPTDPSYMPPSEKAYWEKQSNAMANSGGKVTKESFLKYYEGMWDKHLGATKTPTVERVTEEWMLNEANNPTDPNHRSHLARKEHVATMDTDGDGTISKTEFLAHMEQHWKEIERLASAPSVEPDRVAKMLRNSPLDPSYRK